MLWWIHGEIVNGCTRRIFVPGYAIVFYLRIKYLLP